MWLSKGRGKHQEERRWVLWRYRRVEVIEPEVKRGAEGGSDEGQEDGGGAAGVG